MKPLASGMGSGPRIVDVEALLGLPEVNGFCTRGGKPHHLRSIADPRKERVVRFACKSWACRVCSARLRRVAGEHYATRILDIDPGSLLFVKDSDPRTWETESRRMRSKGIDWVRIGRLGAPGLLIGCAKSKYDEVLSDRVTAIELLGKALKGIIPDSKVQPFRPVNGSKGWCPEKKPKRFTWVGLMNAKEPREVVEKLVSLGIDPSTIRTCRGTGDKLWDCFFDCPPDKREVISTVLQQH